MICFCEDCGARNRLENDGIENGVAVFRCTACRYPNAYAVSESGDFPGRLAEAIRPFPEIVGAFLFREGSRPGIIRQPKGLTPSDLLQLARHLTLSFLAARTLFPDISDESVTIGGRHVFIRPAGKDLFAILVSSAQPLPRPVRDVLEVTNARP